MIYVFSDDPQWFRLRYDCMFPWRSYAYRIVFYWDHNADRFVYAAHQTLYVMNQQLSIIRNDW